MSWKGEDEHSSWVVTAFFALIGLGCIAFGVWAGLTLKAAGY